MTQRREWPGPKGPGHFHFTRVCTTVVSTAVKRIARLIRLQRHAASSGMWAERLAGRRSGQGTGREMPAC